MKLNLTITLLLSATLSALANPLYRCKRNEDGTIDKRCPRYDHCNCKMWVPGKDQNSKHQYLEGDFPVGPGPIVGEMTVKGGAGQGSICNVGWDRSDDVCGYWNQTSGPTGNGCQQYKNIWFSCDQILTND
ncbi:hypothetical protein CORC01_10578 [Colletotrichum orchidophilum]|uniref:Secreted protein n=1 Tax=Colletotrichum orchidophilum TaxID=1209926 RepID=A0A1G4AYB3_9PEZI|nr:uncharacterized protein CORC01_10578 [Colletotrichum orchidophilum]OHE94121.1 hypothetical protein CORC01_10578 [Colletotrichum orchidophilum]